MKKFIHFFTFLPALLFLVCTNLHASNIQISVKPEVTQGANSADITFGLSWDYSWKATVPNNWDAAWVFVKYNTGGAWDHLYLDPNQDPSAGATTNGVPIDYKYGTTGSKTVGVFLFRKNVGSGSNNWSNLKLSAKYSDGQPIPVSQSSTLNVKVFAIEMVYVPQGAFYLGDGSTNTSGGFRQTEANLPYLVESEGPITIGALNSAGGLGNQSNIYTNNAANSIGPAGVLPAEFPKGYNAFYCMKYEVTQGAYVDFLNTLSATQQTGCIYNNNVAAAAGSVVMQMGGVNASDRNRIEIVKPNLAEFGCDLSNDGIYNDFNDGQNIACSMRPRDAQAYADWTGLRPMTELEYEKACRGPLYPVPNEYAWGSTYCLLGSALTNGGTENEVPSVAYVNIMGTGIGLVHRVGMFANDTSNRTVAGASYWGIMEMSGNLWETVVGVANTTGRNYTGEHGDGRITSAGAADISSWPTVGAAGTGMGLRGGSTNENASTAYGHRVSDRSNTYWVGPNGWYVGFRGVRTAE